MLEAGEVGVEELAPGNDDHVDAGIGLVAAEQLAREAFGSIADNGASQLACRGDAQPRRPRDRQLRLL